MKHPLHPDAEILAGTSLRNPVLRHALASVEFGGSSLSIDTLNYLELEISRRRPNVVLEFGSGLSTLCLAQFMRDLYGDEQSVHVISIEQDEFYARRTLEMLQAFHLEANVAVFHAPLREISLSNNLVETYGFSDAIVQTLLQAKPDFILIDGPSGGGNRRFGTVPIVANFVSANTPFYLDDALRDWELSVAQQWSNLPYVEIYGIKFIGKGLLLGSIK